MSIGKSLYRLKPCSSVAGVLAIVASLAAMNAEAVLIDCDSNATKVVTPTNTTITATQDATLTVTEPGEIEILLVGGGGGAGGSASGEGGTNDGASRGGGGGGGGVIHKTSFYVAAGTYPITVGAGGDINTSHSTISSATGGSTSGFGLTALGGGPGGCVDPGSYYDSSPLAGASGGGGSKNSNGKSYQGGVALASTENENRGYAGANATEPKNAGGGGGAGAAGSGGVGGDGYLCDISGKAVYYGGGGSGGRQYSAAVPGQGGGKANYGGGGSGQSTANSTPESGGPGIVIVKFTRTEQKTSNDFSVSGYDAKNNLDDGYAYLVITNNTTLQVTGSASFDVLLVGGGGGAGGTDSSDSNNRGGGGGGGGVIHLRNVPVATGDYVITVGAGGLVNTGAAAAAACGGDTAGFGFTAFGGGPGAPAGGYGDSIDNLGASGGGGATDGSKKTITGGAPKASDENYNFGHAGANAASNGSGSYARNNGGGGGGAGSAASGVVGGDGYACDITGVEVYYGGGGAGGQRYTSVGTPAAPGLGGGKASWGGGGSAQIGWGTVESGGHGIVIIRYKRPQRGAAIFLR